MQVILENFCRTDKRGCPIGRSSVEIVRVLCIQFKIGKPLSEHKTKYFQLFFSHEHPFYELYRVCITYASKIWREMKATVEDFDKVGVGQTVEIAYAKCLTCLFIVPYFSICAQYGYAFRFLTA